MQKIVGRLIVGCVLACWLISNINAQPTLPDNNGDITGDGSGGTYAPDYSGQIANPGTNLWLEITGVSSNSVDLILHNTLSDVEYEIQSEEDLTVANWNSAGFVFGSGITNWTPISISKPDDGSENLFLRIRSWISSDGSGLPDWWELQYFGHLGVDPDADLTGDGIDNWEAFVEGINPTVFAFPGGPQGFTAILNPDSTVTLTWEPSLGAVTGYTIERFDDVLYQMDDITVGPTNRFVDTNFINYPPWDYPITYSIQANYTNGDSGWSDWISPLSLDGTPAAQVLLGSGGSTVLAVTGIPANASGIQVTRVDYSSSTSISGTNTFYVPASSFANGAYTVPTNMTGLGYIGSEWYVQNVCSNGTTSVQGVASGAGYLTAQSYYGGTFIPGRFNDASTQMVQNVTFFLRAAGLTSPFQYSFDAGYGMIAVV